MSVHNLEMCSQLRSNIMTTNPISCILSLANTFLSVMCLIWLNIPLDLITLQNETLWFGRSVGNLDNMCQIVLLADFLGLLILRSAEKPHLSCLSAEALISRTPTGKAAKDV